MSGAVLRQADTPEAERTNSKQRKYAALPKIRICLTFLEVKINIPHYYFVNLLTCERSMSIGLQTRRLR